MKAKKLLTAFLALAVLTLSGCANDNEPVDNDDRTGVSDRDDSGDDKDDKDNGDSDDKEPGGNPLGELFNNDDDSDFVFEDIPETPVSDFEYEYNEELGGIEITRYNGTDEKVRVPALIDGKNVVCIGKLAFKECTSLVSIVIPDGVTRIDGGFDPVELITFGAFADCTSLKSIKMPDSVTEIGVYAFSGCTSLTSITIPDSVTVIGIDAFKNCTSLTSITISDGVKLNDLRAFIGCSSLSEFKVSGNNQNYAVEDGVLYNKDKTILLAYPSGKSTTFTIPDGVTEIGDNAFAFVSLTSIKIPDSVTKIGISAFIGCTSLTSITIPDSVTWIGGMAFDGCKSLKKVSMSRKTEVYSFAFNDCPEDMVITYRD